MIVTNNFEIKKTKNLTSSYIETEFAKLNITPLRWAIVKDTDDFYTVTVSYEKNLWFLASTNLPLNKDLVLGSVNINSIVLLIELSKVILS